MSQVEFLPKIGWKIKKTLILILLGRAFFNGHPVQANFKHFLAFTLKKLCLKPVSNGF